MYKMFNQIFVNFTDGCICLFFFLKYIQNSNYKNKILKNTF